ncbi:MAG: crotonase [Chloroflexi bacterium]|nr:crotonase [Chloroflexota bacterium]MBM3172959.1 crotonase [Chloroflexota bacterium]MBM4450283.1 crotonase [Chloroflexota bacterium]
MYQTITTDVKDRIATVTLSREDKRNAISPTMISELLDALTKYDIDPDARVIVLTGAGSKVFCAGADFGESMGTTGSLVDRYEGQRKFAELFKIVKNLKKPLLGRVNGHAMGGGFGLACACDIVIAADDCRFGTPEINVGLFPYIIMATLLRFTSSPKRLLEMMLTGDRIEAKEAQQLGIVNYVVPREQLDTKISEVALKIASKSPAILRLGRRAFYTMRDMEYEKALEFLASMLTINTMAEDVAEGIAAFLEKREPVWKGK